MSDKFQGWEKKRKEEVKSEKQRAKSLVLNGKHFLGVFKESSKGNRSPGRCRVTRQVVATEGYKMEEKRSHTCGGR